MEDDKRLHLVGSFSNKERVDWLLSSFMSAKDVNIDYRVVEEWSKFFQTSKSLPTTRFEVANDWGWKLMVEKWIWGPNDANL